MATLRQSDIFQSQVSSEKPLLNLPVSPVAGNRLIIVVAHRTGVADAPAEIYTDNTYTTQLTGWDVLAYRHNALASSTFRRGFTVLSRIADGTEGTEFYVQHVAGAPEVAIIEEWRGIGAFIEATTNANTLADETSINSGTINSVAAGRVAYGVLNIKQNTNEPSYGINYTWSNDLSTISNARAYTGEHRNTIATAILPSTPAGDLSTTASFTAASTLNNGLQIGLLIFEAAPVATLPQSSAQLVQEEGFNVGSESVNLNHVISFPIQPTPGNTLIAWVSERLDPLLVNNRNVSGTGWVEAFYHTASGEDATHRRQFWAYTKIAGENEPTQITLGVTDDGATQLAGTVVIQEWSGLGTFVGAVSNDNGAFSNKAAVSTGVYSNTPLNAIGIAASMVKMDGGAPWEASYYSRWSDGFESLGGHRSDNISRVHILTAHGKLPTGGDFQAIANHRSGRMANSGFIGALLVFDSRYQTFSDFSELATQQDVIPAGWTFKQEYWWNNSAWSVEDSSTSGGKLLANSDRWGSTNHIWLSKDNVETGTINKIYTRLSCYQNSGTNRGKNGVIWRAKHEADQTTGYVLHISKEGGEHYLALKKLTDFSDNSPLQVGFGTDLVKESFTNLGFNLTDPLTDFLHLYIEDNAGVFQIYAWQNDERPRDPVLVYDDSSSLLSHKEVGIFAGQISGDDVLTWDVFSFAADDEQLELPKPELLGYLDISQHSGDFPFPLDHNINIPEGTDVIYMLNGSWGSTIRGYTGTLNGQNFLEIENTVAANVIPYPSSVSLMELRDPPSGNYLLTRTWLGTPLEGVITYLLFVRNGKIRDSAIFDIGGGPSDPYPAATVRSSENDFGLAFVQGFNDTTIIDNSSGLWNEIVFTARLNGRSGQLSETLSLSNTLTVSLNSGLSYSGVLLFSLAPDDEIFTIPAGLDPWTPELIKDQALGWFDADDDLSLNLNASGDLVLWYDKSLNNYDVSQLDPTHCPTPVLNSLNNKTTINFDGIDDFLERRDTEAFNLYQADLSVFMVAKYNTINVGTTQCLIGKSRANTMQGRWALYKAGSDEKITNFIATTTSTPGDMWAEPDTIFDSTDWQIFESIIDRDTELALYLNGTKVATTAFNDTTNFTCTARFLIGAYESAVGTSEQWHGAINVAEIILLRDAAEDLRLKIEGYLAHKWGLTSNLDVNHPYKNYAPTADFSDIPSISSISTSAIFQGQTGVIITGLNFGT